MMKAVNTSDLCLEIFVKEKECKYMLMMIGILVNGKMTDVMDWDTICILMVKDMKVN